MLVIIITYKNALMLKTFASGYFTIIVMVSLKARLANLEAVVNSYGNVFLDWKKYHNEVKRINDKFNEIDNDTTYFKNGLRWHANHDFYRDHLLEIRIAEIERKLGIKPDPKTKMEWLVDHRLTYDEIASVKKIVDKEL